MEVIQKTSLLAETNAMRSPDPGVQLGGEALPLSPVLGKERVVPAESTWLGLREHPAQRCVGDSGSPACSGHGRVFLVGGAECGREDRHLQPHHHLGGGTIVVAWWTFELMSLQQHR